MVADFRRRFWISLVLTAPILVLSPMIQGWLGVEEALSFLPAQRPGAFILATASSSTGGGPS